jgi:hypothetical protein
MPTNDAINAAIEKIRPVAKELIAEIEKTPATTKDHYGEVMGFLSNLGSKKIGQLFLAAMVREGYPKDTASQLTTLMGW